MSNLINGLMELRNMLDRVIEASDPVKGHKSNTGLKLTKSGKPRKVSDRKGKPTARDAFAKMICEQMKAELDAFKATLAKKQGAQFTFVANYKKEHPEVYSAFETKWKAEHPDAQTPEASTAATSIATESPIVAEVTATVGTATVSAVVTKKPVKTVKKAAITREIVAPIQASVADELLPFDIGDKTFLRLGTRRENGNHLWTSGHLWMSKKGAKGGHYGELREDGSINMEADEPVC